MSSVTVEMMIRKFEILSDQAKKEALEFLEFLVQKSKPRKKKINSKKGKRILGKEKGKIWISDDFTDPLPQGVPRCQVNYF
jgi:hypothetical protein